MIIDGLGNLYGTTTSGGLGGNGTVFELTPNKAKTAYTEAVLYGFCHTGNCSDGGLPVAGLIRDTDGNLYGTTAQGGNLAVNNGLGFGTAFELVRGKNNRFTERGLYRFCSEANCTDGALPRPAS